MLAFRHQLNLTVLLTVGITVAGLLLLGYYQLNRQVFSLATKELQQYVAVLSQYIERQRTALLYDSRLLADKAAQSNWFILDEKPLATPQNRQSSRTQKYPLIFAVVRADGVVTRSNRDLKTHPVLLKLPRWSYFADALQTQQVQSGWLRVDQDIYYIVTQPVPGKAPARGAIFTATRLFWPQLDVLDTIGMVIFDERGNTLSNHPLSWDLPQFKQEFETLLRQAQEQTGITQQQGLTEANYAYVLLTAPEHNLPRFMLLQALDKRLNFINSFLWPTLGILAVVVALWLFMVSRLHKQLRQVLNAMITTVEHIERENYGYRLQLPKRAELNALSEAFNEMLESLEERERVHAVMAQMTSYDVASKLLNGTLRSDGELRRCTVLVADIPDFSALTRKLTAPVAMQVLNDYLTRMSFCVEANGGWVDKYMGDSIIALFGLEKHDIGAALSAIQAAQDMLDAMTLFNLEAAAPRGLSMRLHITLATGKVVAGTVGASHHANYSGFGETINHAFQLRRYINTDGSQILCDARTHKLLVEAASTSTQQIVDTQALKQDNVTLAHMIIPRSRDTHCALSEQART
jgi:class 3 adenylate cyclase